MNIIISNTEFKNEKLFAEVNVELVCGPGLSFQLKAAEFKIHLRRFKIHLMQSNSIQGVQVCCDDRHGQRLLTIGNLNGKQIR